MRRVTLDRSMLVAITFRVAERSPSPDRHAGCLNEFLNHARCTSAIRWSGVYGPLKAQESQGPGGRAPQSGIGTDSIFSGPRERGSSAKACRQRIRHSPTAHRQPAFMRCGFNACCRRDHVCTRRLHDVSKSKTSARVTRLIGTLDAGVRLVARRRSIRQEEGGRGHQRRCSTRLRDESASSTWRSDSVFAPTARVNQRPRVEISTMRRVRIAQLSRVERQER